jgi:D-threo-aldose 1-dehydrogenase
MDLESRRTLGTAQLKIGPLGFGTAPLGNLYAPVSDADALATLVATEHTDFSWFDTAPLYGYGLAELRLGQYLRQNACPRSVVATKVGRVLEPTSSATSHEHFVKPLSFKPRFDYSRAGIQRSFEQSLRRLGRDRVELLLLHDIDYAHHPTAHRNLVKQLLDETIPMLHQLKSEGSVDAIGLGISDWSVGYEVIASADVDCVLLAGRYTLLDQTASSSGFLETCSRNHVAVLAGGILNSGFLAGGPNYDYRPADAALVGRRAQLRTICGLHGVALPALALQFTAAHPAVASVVVGARSSQEVGEILGWARVQIPEQLWFDLVEARILSSDALRT